MASEDCENRINARAIPVGNALGPRLIPPKNRQQLPSHGQGGLKRQAQRKISEERMRVANRNVATMTGKRRELVNLMERRKIGVLCVQETSKEGIEKKVHGGRGVGESNDGRERVIDFAVAFDLAMINIFFERKINRLITYTSSGRESQIDLLPCKRDHLTEVRNCKVINGERVAAKHRLVVIDCRLRNCKRSKKTIIDAKIKWWKLKDEELRGLFKERVLETVRLHEDVQEWWTKNSKVILRIS
ncbi:uncharacterized protein [Palaemon carinicauda]|uniref:uncharacterized protein n=1 Tax=Palaemon carinicauda TaxID=392227 RepID=UPI0035B5B158